MRAGDEVRIIAQNGVVRGRVGTIAGETFDGRYVVHSDNGIALGTWRKSDLELVAKPTFKVGDEVRVKGCGVRVKGCEGHGTVWGVDGGKVEVDLVYRNKRELLWFLACDLELITDSLKVGDRARVKDLPHVVDWCRGLTCKINFINKQTAQVMYDGVQEIGFHGLDDLERIEEAKLDEPCTVAKVHVAHMELLANLTARVTFEGGGSAFHHTFPLDKAKALHLGDEYTVTIRKAKPGGS